MNKTSSMPKSILRYELDKGQYFDLETTFTQSCFSNKKTDGWWELNGGQKDVSSQEGTTLKKKSVLTI